MASRKSLLSRTSSIFPSSESESTNFNLKPSEGGKLELDEAEVWNLSNTVLMMTIDEAKKSGMGGDSRSSALKRGSGSSSSSSRVSPVSSSSSLPINIPDWSKILKNNEKRARREINNSSTDEDDVDRIPPHEYLARTRGASLSVHEGKGRTLKGRDLRSVRNAIWKKVGFED